MGYMRPSRYPFVLPYALSSQPSVAFSLIAMNILGKVIAVRKFWKKPNTAPGLTGQDPVTHNSTTKKSRKFLSAVEPGLGLAAQIAPAIPVAGTPLKASIEGLLVVLRSIKTRNKNKEDVDHLVQRLQSLDSAISEELPPTAPISILKQRDELAHFYYSSDIKQTIAECTVEVDWHLQDYTLPAVMQTMNMLQVFFESQGQPSSFVQEHIVSVKDATGREFNILVEQCQSHEQFMSVLASYFKNTNRDEVLRGFINRGAYVLYVQDGTDVTQLERWGGVQAGARIIMTAVFEQPYQWAQTDQYRCPRPQCQTWNDSKEENNGWINW
ncbi:hypothetical protein BDP27DRAFT_1360959 [Rhodocollybia butyracea]|uniref:Ubiquitin-like domain-containing protein n=1 Tax=Rhodocollybia butyracea TaxID=206335 RepID=A0A9P5Q237_9AGAR|nr:hypothetical protein BDP27DRAFT_1360959 [Rhodocollybia butyracea]